MKTYVKRFGELSLDELYAILRLRAEVFVVEQNIVYNDLDGLDRDAVHLWLEDSEGIQAYLRIMDRGVESEYVSIGRVLTRKRRQGLGARILSEGIVASKDFFKADRVYLEAQSYVRSLYEKLGFRQISDEFILDGIPHVKMLLEVPAE